MSKENILEGENKFLQEYRQQCSKELQRKFSEGENESWIGFFFVAHGNKSFSTKDGENS